MKDLKQMDILKSTSSQEDTPVNHSASLDVKKVSRIRDTFGHSILDLSKNSDRLGLLEKTLLDTLNSVSTPYLRTWRVKVTPQERLVFQLRASVQSTKEKESGLWATPNTMDHLPQRSPESVKKQMTTARKGRTRPSNLREQVDPTIVKMWRTPDAHSGRGPSSETRMKMKLEKGMPISLNDQVAHPRLMWPTPRAAAGMNSKLTQNIANLHHKKYLETEVAYREGAPGGQLNPTWVEWLMGYPKGWTDLNH